MGHRRTRRLAPCKGGDTIPGNHRGLRHRVRGGTRVAAVTLLAAALGTGTSHADTQPTPTPSDTVLRLPVVPSHLQATDSGCTKASTTVSRALPWAQHRLGAGEFARFGEGDGITVGVVDTGVSASAEALRGRVAGAPAALRDCVGHGTFMAGIVAAAPRSGVQFSGLAPASRILAARGTDASGVAGADLVAQGIRTTVDGGADVVVVSAALARTTRELTSAVRYAQQHDVLIVAPAVPDSQYGQPGLTDAAAAPEQFWPAAQQGVLAVVDVDIDGNRPDGGLVPLRADLAAPGQAVTGIGPLGEGHYLANGASVAAAFVAGAAALVRAHEPGLTAAQVAERLKRGSYPADVPRLDVVAALTGLPPSERPGRTFQDSSVRLRPAAGHNPAQGRAVALAGLCLVGALVLGAVRWLTVRARRAEGA